MTVTRSLKTWTQFEILCDDFIVIDFFAIQVESASAANHRASEPAALPERPIPRSAS
jgi:hypothetical protein